MSNDLLRGRQVAVSLTNKSGGGVVEGDVVIIDSSTAASFTTTTTENQITDMVGVVLETIAGDASGRVCLSGYVPVIKLDASASLGDTFGTDSVAKQASPHNALAAGDFGQVLGTGTTPAAVLWGGYPHNVATGMDNPMTAEGDIIYGGSSGTPTKLVKGDDDDVLTLASGVPTWAAGGSGSDPEDGWLASGETWTYASADAPTYTFTIASFDATSKYSAGMRIKLTDAGSVKYFIITAVTFDDPGSTITVYGGTDYTLAGGAITLPYFSTQKAPLGFPLSPVKWTVEITDVTIRSQGTPVTATWYNLGSLSISIPIGVWLVSYMAVVQTVRAGAGTLSGWATLSTANNSESDKLWSATIGYDTSTTVEYGTLFRQSPLTLTEKDTYYLNEKAAAATTQTLYLRSDEATTIIRAICAYL